MARLELNSKRLLDKASIASVRGETGKYVEDLHARWKMAEERCIDLEVLRLGADKSRDMLQVCNVYLYLIGVYRLGKGGK